MTSNTLTKKLTGKVALVTGGSRGIGAAIAKRLALDGAAVSITYVGAQQKADEVVAGIETEGGRAMAIRADSADAEAVKRAVAETVKTFGRLDILVNNAGLGVVAPLDQFPLDDFDRMVAVNVRSVFVAAKEASRHMDAGGRIITIGSVNADRMPFVGGGPYAMTKGGRGRAHPRSRPRPWTARHHGQQRAARPHCDRHEPGEWSVRRGDEGLHRSWTIRRKRRDRRDGCLPRRP